MDWNVITPSLLALGGVLLGSLITFFINYQNNRFQAKEREKERLEQRREAKIQAKEKWIERDVLEIMDSIASLHRIHLERIVYSNSEFKLKSREEASQIFSGVKIALDTIARLITSLEDDDISAQHEIFQNIYNDYANLLKFDDLDKQAERKNILIKWSEVRVQSGRLYSLLRKKLISIRDE